MDRLKVLVGLIYTQVMFCDEHGKLQFHRVMTDVNRPWLSIKEVLRMVKQALCMDKPIGYNCLIQSIHIDIQYRQVDFTPILETLRGEMRHYLSEGSEVFIQTINDYYEAAGKKAEEKVESWEATVWGVGPLEDMDHTKMQEPEILHVLWVQKEWIVPLIFSENGIPLRSDEPYEPLKVRTVGSESLFEHRIPSLAIDEGRSNWNKETDLRGSPNANHSYFGKGGWWKFAT